MKLCYTQSNNTRHTYNSIITGLQVNGNRCRVFAILGIGIDVKLILSGKLDKEADTRPLTATMQLFKLGYMSYTPGVYNIQ